ncbi:MAG: GAF domain-containing protein [Deltaproteobacteria bacterium]|nr:GAF domain-containing protein [Deltaproteobacteria bacterium]
MPIDNRDVAFRSTLSLTPLLEFWRNNISPKCSYMAQMFNEFEERLQKLPDLEGPIEDLALLKHHQDLLMPLMSVVFPASSWETEIVGAVVPYRGIAFFASPMFERLLMNEDGSRAYYLIIERIYGMQVGLDTPIIQVVPDSQTGLDHYFRLSPDMRFIDVHTVGKPQELSSEDRQTIRENITDLQVLSKFIPSDKFEFHGFTAMRVVDVTEPEVISALQTDLIDQESIFSADGFRRLLLRLRTLFGRPGLMAGIGALQENRALVIKDGCPSSANCIFANSTHLSLADLEGSLWLQAISQTTALRISDLKEEENLNSVDQDALNHGVRSMVISPLLYQGDVIGFLEIMSSRPNDLGPFDTMLTQQIAPLFSVALKRGIDEMNYEVQAVIKEKCTAVHPVVEWRFRKAAFQHMDRLRMRRPSEMEPIIFKDVIPFFA